MIKRIKSSLFAEVFLITCLVLLAISLFTYGLLAFFMPKTYSGELGEALKRQAEGFVAELSEVSMPDSGGLFDQFIQNENVSGLELYTEDGTLIPTPSGSSKGGWAIAEDVVQETLASFADTASEETEQAPVLSGSYWFSFQGNDERYMLIVYGRAVQEAKLRQAFVSIFPMLLLFILLAALGVSFGYSHIITKPVVRLSRISERISDLELGWELSGKRPDELGALEQSLNEMSRKLAATLAELKQANAQLALDMEREKAQEQARLDFFSAVSHELKTPITIIRGQLEGMYLKIGVYKDRDKYLARALEVTGRLESMVQEILTILRLETTKEEFRDQYFDCIPLICAYLEEAEDLIAGKQLQIRTHFSGRACLTGNKLLMEKVFSNLIGNAVKYSPEGASVTVGICPEKAGWSFLVENTGSHIPEEKFRYLFEAFYCMDPSRSRQSAGNGLGLYLVQRILEQYGSTCRVCNTEQGVRFWFTVDSPQQAALHINHK